MLLKNKEHEVWVMVFMSSEEVERLKSSVALLESKVDLLEAELTNLNVLLIRFGFPEGIESLKMAIEEMLDEGPYS